MILTQWNVAFLALFIYANVIYLLKCPCGQLEMIKQGFLNMSAIWKCRFVTHNIHLHYMHVLVLHMTKNIGLLFCFQCFFDLTYHWIRIQDSTVKDFLHLCLCFLTQIALCCLGIPVIAIRCNLVAHVWLVLCLKCNLWRSL